MIIALGVGGIIVTQGTDLSAGRIIGLAAIISSSLLQATDYAYRMYPNLPQLPVILPILLAMAVCGLMGAINGFAVAKLKIPPFIATMGTMLLAYGSIGGIVTGVLIFQVLNYGLSFIGVSTYLQFIIKGIIIIAAVALDTRKYVKKK